MPMGQVPRMQSAGEKSRSTPLRKDCPQPTSTRTTTSPQCGLPHLLSDSQGARLQRARAESASQKLKPSYERWGRGRGEKVEKYLTLLDASPPIPSTSEKVEQLAFSELELKVWICLREDVPRAFLFNTKEGVLEDVSLASKLPNEGKTICSPALVFAWKTLRRGSAIEFEPPIYHDVVRYAKMKTPMEALYSQQQPGFPNFVASSTIAPVFRWVGPGSQVLQNVELAVSARIPPIKAQIPLQPALPDHNHLPPGPHLVSILSTRVGNERTRSAWIGSRQPEGIKESGR
ncbi:hypothetical protein BDK51DRAFT_52069 [Blyttiomyces helicus]|uniref:Uncharacterized protein n=1 Tax=Blyttiomyces helicus TaxID=388810 RepID=A0A4P9VZL6_9FUNG|nr:hypothetical protein BDK51DRAFT_52069 [Blyttiomyces helicus]|eukprot:RKO85271.1 hypothetical protein BDK51DRAFT_52069 [Blyttiomyces helicus]